MARMKMSDGVAQFLCCWLKIVRIFLIVALVDTQSQILCSCITVPMME